MTTRFFPRNLTVLALAGALYPGVSTAQDPELRFGGRVPPEVESIYDSGLAWLAQKQDNAGSWQDNNQGSGVTGLCVMAFLASGEDPNFGRYAINIRRGLRAMITSQDAETGYLPDSMYHHGFAMLALAEAYGAVDESLLWQPSENEKSEKGRSLGEALDLAIRCAATSQKKNRWGGWRYTPDASDADTSVTGAVLMGLLAARNAGMDVPDETVNAALEYMRRSTGRDGSVAYTGGFGGMGQSMNRSAIATLVAAVAKEKETWEYKATLDHIASRLEHDESGHYIEYFRYYMAQALFQGDYDSWQKWNAATVRQLEQSRQEDGSFNGSAYSTAMSLLALGLNYRFLPIYER
ncbi:MAG: squalene--hopene cyclase [Verrucomicrobiales bacterium]|nr:squalene--hopene cyclase [Verrucomicrobiales bacterium]